MTQISPAQFVVDLPAFSNATIYPETSIQMYLSDAYLMLSPQRWRRMLTRGVEYFTAHFLVLDAQANATAANGGAPGLEVGPLASKTIGPLSKSYDTALGVDPNAGHWAQTMYGRRFIQWQRLVGMAGAYVKPKGEFGLGPNSGPAWPGPLPTP